MIENPKVSVLLPVYNAERYVGEAVESILSQTFCDFEIVAIDDGSKDRSLEILNSFNDDRIRVFHQDNRGLPATLNKGAKLCRSNYIARMDADDICKPYRFQRQYEFLESNPQIALVSGAMEYIDDTGVVLGRTYPITNPRKIRKKILQEGNVIVHPAVMMRREAFFQCGGYCEALVTMQDGHLWGKFLRNGYQLSILPQVMIAYRLIGNAISNREKSDEQIRLMKEILQYDDPSKDLLYLFSMEVEKNRKKFIPQGQRTASIQATMHCKISKVSKKLHIEKIIEMVVCGLQNILH